MTQPTVEEVSPESLSRKVLSESLQHPSTLLPAATAVLSGLYMGLIQFSPGAFTTTVAAGTIALVSALFHYFVRGETIMHRELSKTRQKRKQGERRQAEALISECQARAFFQGADATRELLAAYDRLTRYLKDKFASNRPAGAERFLVLSEEVLAQGLALIRRSLDLFIAIRELDYEKMSTEMAQWQRELDSGIAPDEETQELLKGRLTSHQKRLDLHTSHQKNLLANLSQCEVLEASLDAGYLELVDLVTGHSVPGSARSVESLERLVETTKRVEEKLRRTSSLTHNDEIYDISKNRQ